MRSLLLVPMHDSAAIDAALAADADALVFDLAGLDMDLDPSGRARARHSTRDVLRSLQVTAEKPHIYLRLSGLHEEAFDQDLAMLVGGEPDGILLSDSGSGADVQHLGAKLAVQEAEYGLADGELGIIAEAGGRASALFSLGSYAASSERLIALTWHAERLAMDIGSQPAEIDGALDGPLQTARHLTLFAARAAEVAAIDTPCQSTQHDTLLAECREARRHGFNAKLASTAAQVAVINAVFGYE